MPSYQSHFEPSAPRRVATDDSQQSRSSGTASPAPESFSSPSFSRRSRTTMSQTEESFFGAIASRMRQGRSRSRSQNRRTRDRSSSPMLLPPESLPSTPTPQPTISAYAAQRSQQPRHASHASQSSISSTTTKVTRPSLQGPSRRSTSGSDMWRGRHSNSWLFNDFSFTETAKDLCHRRK